jgi:hypothetical protein
MLFLKQIFKIKKIAILSTFLFLAINALAENNIKNNIQQDSLKFIVYKGKVINSNTRKPLALATLLINNTNISTVTNIQGKYQLKVPEKYKNNKITISFLGYTSEIINLYDLKKNNAVIKLETYIEELSEVKINVKDASTLVAEVLRKKGENYADFLSNMTAFYRETIKKRRTYVSLSEAVIGINKQSYTNSRNDILKLYKARKSVDYSKLDTVAFKLKGGPFSNIYIDIIKNHNSFFENDMFALYNFTFDTSTKIDNRIVFVVNFKQKPNIKSPLYYGKLYIDAHSLALISAKFHLNLVDKIKASRLFIVKKPRNARVYPIETSYLINYREKNGKWYFGYSRIELGFKINWDKKWFNTIYRTTSELAITDWHKNTTNKYFKPRERLRTSVIMIEKASGFSDPNFWGAYNVIEPEKSIESAIKKIKKQLKNIDN